MLDDATSLLVRVEQITGTLIPLEEEATVAATLMRMTAPPAEHVTADVVAVAYVNEGRWVVDCPFCAGAQLASRVDRRFWCVECQNAEVAGAWVTVSWPLQEREIEAALGDRPKLNTHWLPDETVSDLVSENELHAKES